jgi:exopolyphosphatase/guanosine-5'-triphosphate,3'-diphosphate pyrophosphatase
MEIKLYGSRDTDARRPSLRPAAQVDQGILAGACIIRSVMENLGKDTHVTVRDRGLRHGVMAERCGS